MRIGMLSPIAWRTPPRHYGPWELVVSNLTENLVKLGVDVTLFATGDSETTARLSSVVQHGYEEDPEMNVKVWEGLHIANAYEHDSEYDILHNHFDYLPLAFSGSTTKPIVSTIHGFSSESIIPVFEKFNDRVNYVAISEADKSDRLKYAATIHHGIEISEFEFNESPDDYLLFFGRIHPDKGPHEAIEIARKAGKRLLLAGIVHDHDYFESKVVPFLGPDAEYVGTAEAETKNDLLRNASALLHPIGFEEPFGLSVIESFACGTPVIAYDKGSMPELIDDGINGYLVNDVKSAANAVGRLDEIDRQQVRLIAEERFSALRMAKDYLRLYETLLT